MVLLDRRGRRGSGGLDGEAPARGRFRGSWVRLAGVVAAVAVTSTTAVVAAPAAAAFVGPGVPGGQVVAWGDNSAGQTTVPASLTGEVFTAIDAGIWHNLALTPDGQVRAFGNDNFGQTDLPASLDGRTITAVAAGARFSLALTSDGQVIGWGSDDRGATVPSGLTGKKVTAISAGGFHGLALTSDGRVTAWPWPQADRQTTVPASLDGKTVIAISAGNYHSLALTSDGKVTAWGKNSTGQSTVPESLNGRTVTGISAGGGHNLVLTSDGQVIAWGANDYGESTVPEELSGRTVTAISAGTDHSLALTSDGQIVAWGNLGQSSVPASLTGRTVIAISAGQDHNVAIVRPAAVPGAPTGVSGTAGDGQVQVSWSAPGNDGGAGITRYTATAAADGQPSRTCLTTGETTCQITDLTNDVAYQVSVTAANGVGVGAASDPITLTPSGAPAVPSGLTPFWISDHAVTLTWDPTPGAVSYQVRRNNAAVATTTAPAYTDPALPPTTTFSYTVTAIDAAGRTGPASTPVTARTLAQSAAVSAGPASNGTAGPAGLTAAVVTPRAITLTWAPVDGATGYTVWRYGIPIISTTAPGAIDYGLVGNTPYSYTVTALLPGPAQTRPSAPVTLTTPS